MGTCVVLLSRASVEVQGGTANRKAERCLEKKGALILFFDEWPQHHGGRHEHQTGDNKRGDAIKLNTLQGDAQHGKHHCASKLEEEV